MKKYFNWLISKWYFWFLSIIYVLSTVNLEESIWGVLSTGIIAFVLVILLFFPIYLIKIMIQIRDKLDKIN